MRGKKRKSEETEEKEVEKEKEKKREGSTAFKELTREELETLRRKLQEKFH